MNTDRDSPEDDDLRPECDRSDLKGGVRGKYLDRYRAGTNLALLAPDVRAAFPTDDDVNRALRSLMQSRHWPTPRFSRSLKLESRSLPCPGRTRV